MDKMVMVEMVEMVTKVMVEMVMVETVIMVMVMMVMSEMVVMMIVVIVPLWPTRVGERRGQESVFACSVFCSI